MQVTIPVTVSVPASWTDRVTLAVTATLCSPRGYPAPVAYAPSPSAEYLGEGGTGTASVALTAGIAQLRGEVKRPLGRQELAVDVKGTGTRRLDWLVPGGGRQLAGSHEFRFTAAPDAGCHTWLEVAAQLHVSRAFRRRTVSDAASSVVPLIVEEAVQAGATLVLYEGNTEPGSRVFVGRPLDLPLMPVPEGVVVMQGSGVPGTIRWTDDVDGCPGYLWFQTSADVLARVGDSAPLTPGTSVLLKPGTELSIGSGPCLIVMYDTGSSSEWAARRTLDSVLDVDVVIDGETTVHHTTTADYVTVGRSHRDICIDRPDISRSHGVLELGKNGWTYCHKSAVAPPAFLLRDGAVVAHISREDAVPVKPGDVVQLTQKVSLALR